jgi:hypothetical protein
MNWADILFGLGSAATAGAAEEAQMEIAAQQELQRRQDIEWQKQMAEQQFALQQQAQQFQQQMAQQQFGLEQQQFEFNKQMVLEQLNLDKNRNLLETVLNVSEAMRKSGVSDPNVAKGVFERLGHEVSDDLVNFTVAGAQYDKALALMKFITDESEIPADITDEKLRLILRKSAQLNRYAVRLQEQAVQKGDIELQLAEQQLQQMQAVLGNEATQQVLGIMAELGEQEYNKLKKDRNALNAFIQNIWNSPVGVNFLKVFGEEEGYTRLRNTIEFGLSIPPVIVKKWWLESQAMNLKYRHDSRLMGLQHYYNKDMALFNYGLQKALAQSADPIADAEEFLQKNRTLLRRFGVGIPSLGVLTIKELSDGITNIMKDAVRSTRRLSEYLNSEPIADFWLLSNPQLANVVVNVDGQPKTLQMWSEEAKNALNTLGNFWAQYRTNRRPLTPEEKQRLIDAADKIYAFVSGRNIAVVDSVLSTHPNAVRAIPVVRDRVLYDSVALVKEVLRHFAVPEDIRNAWEGRVSSSLGVVGRQPLGVPNEVSNEAQRRSVEQGQQQRLQRNQRQPSSPQRNRSTPPPSTNPLRERRYHE